MTNEDYEALENAGIDWQNTSCDLEIEEARKLHRLCNLAARRIRELERRDRVPALADKLLALREAWLDLPFAGICPPGWGDPIQNIINAVTEIVDPDRTLRETAEAKRRGDIASLRTRAEWHAEQVLLGTKAKQSAEDVAHWAAQRDAAIAECRERFGVEIIIPERKPWQP